MFVTWSLLLSQPFPRQLHDPPYPFEVTGSKVWSSFSPSFTSHSTHFEIVIQAYKMVHDRNWSLLLKKLQHLPPQTYLETLHLQSQQDLVCYTKSKRCLSPPWIVTLPIPKAFWRVWLPSRLLPHACRTKTSPILTPAAALLTTPVSFEASTLLSYPNH